jgi:hypothetical protein
MQQTHLSAASVEYFLSRYTKTEAVMKFWKILIMASFAGLSMVSCKSPVYVQRDESTNLALYHTYSWVETRASENDQSKRVMAYADVSVRNATNAELAKKGWREVTDNPDALISYDVLVERTTEQTSSPIYSQPFTRVYYNPFMRRWGTIYYPSQFVGYQNYDVPVKEGTITITMSDAKTDKVIWQAWTTERMDYANLTSDEINRSVRNIFKKFDVTQ